MPAPEDAPHDEQGPRAPLDLQVALTPFQKACRYSFGWTLQTIVAILTWNWDFSVRQRKYRIKRSIYTGAATGPCRLVIFLPQNGQVTKNAGVVVHCHGGGWTICRPEIEYSLAQTMADELGTVVVAPDYHKAPYRPYPHALLQCRAVLEWIASGGLSLLLPASVTVDTTRIALSGCSAGGNLAAALTLLAVRVPLPHTAQVTGLGLLYPALDLSRTYSQKLALSQPEVQVLPRWLSLFFFHSYLPQPIDKTDPLVSPLLAKDAELERFPRTAVITADHDYLADEGDAFVNKLKSLRVEVHHRKFEEVGHAFDLVPVVPWSRKMIARNRQAKQEAHALVVEVLREAVAPRAAVHEREDSF
ncbi:Alpha/Beta hydrolase protein [Auriculariales sp. MPI-PUGE-AT-0066]|nr:Alpha/Beta hydrolase protein [Auriculariales sp. MPI-PUGE-AT-0066]